MGSKAFNGSLVHIVYDITRDPTNFVLTNVGKYWTSYSVNEFQRGLDSLIEEADEEDCYIYWYNSYLL